MWTINDRMQIRLQCLVWLSLDIVQDSDIMGPVEIDIVYDCRIFIVQAIPDCGYMLDPDLDN